MIVYNKFWEYVKEHNIVQNDLLRNGVTGPVLHALRYNKGLNTVSIDKVCKALGCQPSDIMECTND